MLLTCHFASAQPAAMEFVGRIVVVFCFNELVALGLGLATTGKRLGSLKSHLSMLAVAADRRRPSIAALGAGTTVAAWPVLLRLPAAVLTTMLSQAGLWAEAYLVTGMIMDAIHGQAPSRTSVLEHPVTGMRKAMVYGGVFIGSLYTLGVLWKVPLIRWAATEHLLIVAMLAGAIAFPLIKTVIESFDGSPPFFQRLRSSYLMPILSARGAVIGFGVGCGFMLELPGWDLPMRAWFGFGCGVLAYAGIDVLRDLLPRTRDRYRLQSLHYYIAHGLLGGFIGAAIGFYLDVQQVAVVTAKFHRYLAAGNPPELFDIYPLVSKWGHLELGMVGGGVSAAHREPGGRDQLVDCLLALRDQPDVHEGLLLEEATPNAPSSRAKGWSRSERT